MLHSFLALVLVSILLLGHGEASPAVATPAAEPLSRPPVLVIGDAPAGADITGVSVTIDPTDDVLADLEIGESAPPALSPDAISIFSGTHFEVRLDPAAVPTTYLKSDGLIFAMVTLLRDGARSLTTTTSARAVLDPETGGLAWVGALGSSLRAATSSRGRAAGRLLPTLDAEERGGSQLGDESASDPIVLRPGDYAPVFDSHDPTDTPAGCTDRKLAQRVRSVTIGTSYPVGRDKSAMTVTSSTGASYGTAFSVKDSRGRFGEFRAGEGKFTRSGWGFSWTGSAASRSYRKGVLYAKFIRTCVRGCTRCYRFWKPLSETGGTGSNRGIPRPSWGHCVRIERGLWWRDDAAGRNYTYGGAVKFAGVIGIDLSISREYNSSQRIWYRATKARRMCGNNAHPARAGKVMMRRAR